MNTMQFMGHPHTNRSFLCFEVDQEMDNELIPFHFSNTHHIKHLSGQSSLKQPFI